MVSGIRKAILELDSYRPGKPIAELLRENPGLAKQAIIKLASNENPLGPSPKAIAAVASLLKQAHRYPEATSPLLRAKLGKIHGFSQDAILITSGADEALRLVAETLLEHGDTAVISQYAFSRFRQHIRFMGATALEIPARNFTHDLAGMAKAAREAKAKVIFIANPNNPTGTFNTKEQLEEFFSHLGGPGALEGDSPWVVLDEAYYDFAKDAYPKDYPESLPGALKLYSKTIVMRTFSKVVGLAGLRVAYAVADSRLMSLIHRARLIFNVSSLAQAAALAALDDEAFIRKTLRVVRQGRVYLTGALEELGFEIVKPCATNFLFARVPQGTAAALHQKLLALGVILRPVDEPGLERFVRITIGNPAQNRRLVQALGRLLNAKVVSKI